MFETRSKGRSVRPQARSAGPSLVAVLAWGALALSSCTPDTDGDGVPDAEDCAPNDAATFPGAPELCDERDNDCDGIVPEGELVDVDGDGFTPCAGDCADEDPERNPDALDLCDRIDDDCDGAPDDDGAIGPEGAAPIEGVMTIQDAWASFRRPDGASTSPAHQIDEVEGPGDVNGDGYADVLLATAAGPVWLFYGPFCAGEYTMDQADAVLYSSGVWSGRRLFPLGDLNSDGFAEVQVDGEVWAGPVRGEQLPEDASWWFSSGHGMGPLESFASGDFNGDGMADLAAGSGRSLGWPPTDETFPDGTPADRSTGQVAVFLGPLAAGALNTGEADAWLVGEGHAHHLGTSLAAADDISGDGADELFVGAGGYVESDSPRVGAVYLVHSPFAGVVHVGDEPTKWVGSQGVGLPSEGLGGLVVSPGDLTGDGVPDALASGSAQRSYVLDGGTAPGRHQVGGGDLAPIALDNTGWALDAGDLNGNGQLDVISGRWFVVDVFLDVIPREVDGLTWEPRVEGFEPNTPRYFESSGGTVAGDLNNDGVDDFALAGDRSASLPGPVDGVFLFLGRR